MFKNGNENYKINWIKIKIEIKNNKKNKSTACGTNARLSGTIILLILFS